jgi:uncharacterized protein YbaP (TraB family)
MPNATHQLLWQLTHPTCPGRTSFLFGTMHVRDQRAFQHIDQIYACIQACSAFACELDLKDPAAAQLSSVMNIPPTEWLDQQLSPKRYARACQIARKAFGIDLHSFRYFHPMLLQQLLSESLLADDYPKSLDSHLYHYAQQADKDCMGLETWEEQIETLEGIDLDDLRRNFLHSLRNVRAFRRQHEKLVELYVAGDIRRLYRHVKKSTGSARYRLIYLRNHIMAERITEQHQQAPTFFAVGAGHLAGGKGILRSLKQAGFQLTSSFSHPLI